MGYKFDAYVGKSWRRRPRGHEEERGMGLNGMALTHWAGNCGGDDRKR